MYSVVYDVCFLQLSVVVVSGGGRWGRLQHTVAAAAAAVWPGLSRREHAISRWRDPRDLVRVLQLVPMRYVIDADDVL